MQEFHDARTREIKVLSEFNPELEKAFMAMSIDDFYFHVLTRKNHDG